MPLVTAAVSILTTFSAVWALTYVTNVSIVVQFLVALVGLGVSIDYSLLMIFRFREELHHGRDVESALVETMTHAGRSVVVSGSTVAIGLLSMVLLPLPFIRSIGIGGMLIPLVAVLSTLTLTPGAPLLDRAPDRPAARDPEADRLRRPGRGGLLAPLGRATSSRRPRPDRARRARARRPAPDPGREAQPGRGRGEEPARARATPSTGATRSPPPASAPGVLKPYVVLVEHGATPQSLRARRRRRSSRPTGIDGAAAPPGVAEGRHRARRGDPVHRRRSPKPARKVISNLQHDVLPDVQQADRRERAGDARRRRAGGPRLRPRRLRQLPVRPRLRHPAHVRAADARLQVGRAAAEGGDPQPDLARLRARRRRLHLPAGPRQRGDLGDQGDPGGDLRGSR